MSADIEKSVEKILQIKKWFVFSVLVLMMLIVAASVVELAVVLYKEITDTLNDSLFLDINEFLRIFGFVFIVLIGFELLESITMYFKKNVIHAEVVILIAVIAISRKIILLDLEKYEPMSLVGLAAIMVALGVCYYFLKRSNEQN